MTFRNNFGQLIFDRKYRNSVDSCGTWKDLTDTLVDRITGKYLRLEEINALKQIIYDMKFIPAGRYLYYAGRPAMYMNNCFAFRAEDSREGWSELGRKHFLALMCGGGCGTYYGDVRANGSRITRTGGTASGSVSLMKAMNEIGRNVMQGGTRRSALWAGLPWYHKDIPEFLTCKEHSDFQRLCKEQDFTFPLPMDMTNISICYDRDWYDYARAGDPCALEVFKENIKRACIDGEPGFSFDITEEDRTLRNA